MRVGQLETEAGGQGCQLSRDVSQPPLSVLRQQRPVEADIALWRNVAVYCKRPVHEQVASWLQNVRSSLKQS